MTTTKARTPAGSGAGTGTGSERINTSDQVPTAIVFDEIPGTINSMSPGLVGLNITDGTLFSGTVESTNSAFVYKFTAADNGRIAGITYTNGAVAMDGSVGWELDFTNADQGDETCAYFGFGSGTEAAKATDKDAAVSAGASVTLSNSIVTTASHFDKGDVIEMTADQDGSAAVGTFILLISYESQGHV